MSDLSGKILSVCATMLMAIVLSVPVYGLANAMGSAEAASAETVLRAGFMQRVDHLNPNVGLSDAAYVFYGLVYDTTHTVENDFEVIGNLALDWRIVPETDPELVISGEPYGSVWEYDIATGVRWHDGQPLTVDDVTWTVNLNAEWYDDMWAYQPYGYFMDYAEAIDSDTVRIHYFDRDTGEPMPASYAYLLCIPILPRHKLGAEGADYIGFQWTGVFDGEEYPIVGTGPFTATEYIWDEFTEGDHITLVRNPTYHWMAERGMNVSFDKIIMYFYDDPSAMAQALQKGDLDIAQFPPQTYLGIKNDVISGELEDVDYFDGIKCTQYWTEIGINYAEAGPNQARLDPAVRQAIAMATDKEFIKSTFYANLADVGTTLISPVNTKWHYEPTAEELYDFDLDAAAALLEEAGYIYPEGGTVREVTADSLSYDEGWCLLEDPLTFDMLIRREYPEEQEIASYLKQVWAEIGINLEYRIVDEVTLSTEVYNYLYDMMIWYWSADADPNYMLFCQAGQSIGGWNDNCYDNETYNSNYLMSVQEMDEVQRKVYTDECQRTNYLDAFYIILAYPHQTYAWRTDTFTGWGDWEENPCMSFDHFWTGPQLMFQLVPVIEVTPPPSDDGDAWILYAAAGAAIAVLAVVAVAALLMMKKKKGGKKETSEGKSPLGE
ncbi:MAG TPA: ABC transporter substrate-binding protein [Thermoplasmata archaeon]|nr:ABC transporter substrate-binding protein [Thermoplasmata archaeon]